MLREEGLMVGLTGVMWLPTLVPYARPSSNDGVHMVGRSVGAHLPPETLCEGLKAEANKQQRHEPQMTGAQSSEIQTRGRQ